MTNDLLFLGLCALSLFGAASMFLTQIIFPAKKMREMKMDPTTDPAEAAKKRKTETLFGTNS